MPKFETRKIYYIPGPNGSITTRAETAWRRVDGERIGVEASVAFPEGGGEAADIGWIRQGGREAHFSEVRKVFCRSFHRPGLPIVTVGGEVQITPEIPLGPEWDESAPITIEIDGTHRLRKARAHTAAHLLYLAARQVFPDPDRTVTGWSVDADAGRFEIVGTPAGPDEIDRIRAIVTDWIAADHPIRIDAHPEEPEARIWVAGGESIPCGGNHVPSTGLVGGITLRRKSQGRDRIRIYYAIDHPIAPELIARILEPAAV